MSPFLITAVQQLAKLGCLGFVLLHIWTIVLAYKASSGATTVLSAVLIGIAELYWAAIRWQQVGLFNSYTCAVAAVIAIFSTASLLARSAEKRMLASILSKKGPNA
jgi:hypothetical protein